MSGVVTTIGGRRRRFRSLVVVSAAAALFLIPTAALAADAWAGVRNCAAPTSCRVQSFSTGNVEHERCASNFTGCVIKASWSNGSTYRWRTSWHGGGSQGVIIATTGTLAQQSATCTCPGSCPQ
jgi:hypothetical protein